MLDDALGLQGSTVDDVAGLELLLETGDVDGQVLHAVDVAEAGQLRQTTGQRGLAALEAGALAATGAGLLAVHTAAGGLALASSMAATDALAVLTRALCGLEVLEFHSVSPCR